MKHLVYVAQDEANETYVRVLHGNYLLGGHLVRLGIGFEIEIEGRTRCYEVEAGVFRLEDLYLQVLL